MSKKTMMYLGIAAVIVVIIVIYNKSKANPANATPVSQGPPTVGIGTVLSNMA